MLHIPFAFTFKDRSRVTGHRKFRNATSIDRGVLTSNQHSVLNFENQGHLNWEKFLTRPVEQSGTFEVAKFPVRPTVRMETIYEGLENRGRRRAAAIISIPEQ